MEIDIAAETKKIKKQIRKVGDKSGVGCPLQQDRKGNFKQENQEQ